LFFQFVDFVIDTDRRELKGAAGIIHVEPQVFDLLAHFVQNANRVISKDELIEGIWKGRAISDAALNSRITSARRAIGDSGEKQAIIRTIQRRGFLFAAEPARSLKTQQRETSRLLGGASLRGEMNPSSFPLEDDIERSAHSAGARVDQTCRPRAGE